MSIKKVNTKIDFVAAEHDVLHFWEENSIFEKRKNLNKGKQKWSFIDGPITANNPMGVHHAWGRSLKDIYNRYKSMYKNNQRRNSNERYPKYLKRITTSRPIILTG